MNSHVAMAIPMIKVKVMPIKMPVVRFPRTFTVALLNRLKSFKTMNLLCCVDLESPCEEVGPVNQIFFAWGAFTNSKNAITQQNH